MGIGGGRIVSFQLAFRNAANELAFLPSVSC